MKERNESHFWIFVLIGIFLIITTTGFARMAYGIILPFMQEGLHLSTAQSGMLGTILFLGYLLTVGTSGIFTIRFGAKSVLLIGSWLVVISLMGLAFVSSFWIVAFCMLCAGAGSALVYTPLMSITVGWFPNKRGTVMGLLLSGAGIGMLFSGIIVPYVVRTFPEYSWRGAWFLFGVIACIVVFAASVVLKNPEVTEDERKRSNKSLLWKTKELYIIAWMYFIVGVVYLIPNLYQTSFMIDSGISASISGTVYAIAGICSIAGAPGWGFISDRIGIKKSLCIALLLAVIGDMVPIIFGNITGFIVSAMIWGSSLGGILLLIQVAASKQVSPKYVSMAISFISVFYAVGQMIGPGLAGLIIGESGYTAAYGLGAFGFFMCICLELRLKRGNLTNSAYLEK
ncbi:MFS transporter [Bacillus thuringiensis]|uniref:MFS transporter n=4 Tax=Bacillus thuringiensis TaxID=1428 RepID=A0ABD5I0U3_BACTU|nr:MULTISPECIES: MFS transporter [Bacillus]EEM95885.1 Major facilitator superfamily MFS_1 [Bacillus thuringiensis IBL 200]KAB2376370.1 YbfB/YjiJ family MFS transporter [Bacillus sp. RM2(2019)]KXY65269.1 MFS transporter [Bacillus cereus]MCC6080892.1 MFS transporter [Bacillus thuringiensis]MCR6780765.1 MFS transporter [Bacillus thuringiensis]